ncbi:hypothetical protein BDP81DRAFT_476934 [Colletotrichum phormii]|uniref:Uncharacterized protein n=1 Tax=Colletotrichum phormii TaxID=359342 RepID=A0AAI9ZDL4_9PEZI|nr:uncharacterized protein BDP81DRAFT_476934 [Colletotrichum phormii]KAK1621655.1 hypothetical protein BDP81DRAFT_476934 [Colletotrichum phormii]
MFTDQRSTEEENIKRTKDIFKSSSLVRRDRLLGHLPEQKKKQNEETPNEQTPNEKTPNEKTPNEKTPNEKTPNEKTPNEKVKEKLDRCLNIHLDFISFKDIPCFYSTAGKPFPTGWKKTFRTFANGHPNNPDDDLQSAMRDALHTLRIDGGNLRQLITILGQIVGHEWESFPKRIYIDFSEIQPTAEGRIWKNEIDFIKDLSTQRNIPFDPESFQFVNDTLNYENDDDPAATKRLRAIITLLFSVEIFPNLEEVAIDKRILAFFKDSPAESLATPSLAIRGLDKSISIPWSTVHKLSNNMPTKHLLLEGCFNDLPAQEGQGIKHCSDITLNKINLGGISLTHLIDIPFANLSALRYIGEDAPPQDSHWTDPLQWNFTGILNHQGRNLQTLCLGLAGATNGYRGGPVPFSKHELTSLTHLWIDTGKFNKRWELVDVIEFLFSFEPTCPPNLTDIRITGRDDAVIEWIQVLLGYGNQESVVEKSVLKSLKNFGIRNKDLVEKYQQRLKELSCKIELYHIDVDEDIKLWRIPTANRGKLGYVLE